MTTSLIDFHSHYYEASWSLLSSQQRAGALAQAWPLLTNIDEQFAVMDAAGIDAKVLTAPAAAIVAPGRQPAPDLVMRINDRFAELVSLYPKRLFALATVDAFRGEAAAREAERAIQSLKLHGICVDCALADRYLDAPEARPTFEVAASLSVPVFVHPVGPVAMNAGLARLGHVGVLLARGTETAISLLALLRSGMLDELPNLNIVFPMIGSAVFLFAAMGDQELAREEGWHGRLPSVMRQRLYVDTMGFDPATIRCAVELLGPEHVLVGSDWPIMPIAPRQKVAAMLSSLHLTPAQSGAIMAGNALRLLVRGACSGAP